MFCSLNRWLGFPERIYCDSSFTMEQLVNFYNGKRPCFASVNRFKSRNKPFMDRAPFDFDSHLNWRIPYKETHNLLQFAQKNDIPHRIICSGGKGFHFYFLFQEIPLTEQTNSQLFSIQWSLKKYYNFQSVDVPLLGKKSLLIRIPTTRHVSLNKKSKVYEVNGNYCRSLSDSEFERGLPYIKILIKEPGTLPTIPNSLPSIQDIIDVIPDYKFRKKTNGSLDIDINPGGILVPTISAVGLPCLQQIAKNPNPCHFDKIELVSWLKVQGYRDMAIVSFIRNLKWQGYILQKTIDNVSSVKGRFPRCSYLRGNYSQYCSKCSFRRN